MPQVSLQLSSQKVLVDSGATESVMKRCDLTSVPKLSGTMVKERYAVPLSVQDEDGESFKHSFLLSSSS